MKWSTAIGLFCIGVVLGGAQGGRNEGHLEGAAPDKQLRGLFVMTMGTKSHVNFFRGVMEALANNGHKITFISPFDVDFKNDNIKLVFVDQDYYDKLMGNMFEMSLFHMFKMTLEVMPEICVSSLKDSGVTKVLQEEFDYVILSMYFADCYLPFIYEREMPYAYASPNVLMPPQNSRFGALDFPSISPHKMLPFTYPLSFWGRVVSALGNLFVGSSFFYVEKRTEIVSREHGIWSHHIPSLDYLHSKASLAIVNSVKALEHPIKPSPPNVIYAGGIHIQPPKPLPEDLKNWLDDSGEEGFILFSLGTAVRPSDITEEHLATIVKVLGSINVRVIWKWDTPEGIQNLPSNIKLAAWLPQQDILAHPNIKAFISHGGLLSVMEALYYGVPVVGMPVFGDQANNVVEVVATGWGHMLTWADLTEEDLRYAITDTLSNNSLRETVLKRSKLMRDWPQSPSEEVVFWIEYIVRHEGAFHLQSPFVNMEWYQIYNVDVWAFVATVQTVILVLIYLCLKFLFKLVYRQLFKVKTE